MQDLREFANFLEPGRNIPLLQFRSNHDKLSLSGRLFLRII